MKSKTCILLVVERILVADCLLSTNLPEFHRSLFSTASVLTLIGTVLTHGLKVEREVRNLQKIKTSKILKEILCHPVVEVRH